MPNQCAPGMVDPKFAICADPNSKQKYPHLPICTISPDNWDYRYPDPAGYPGPADRRVPIDPVTGAAGYSDLATHADLY